MTDSVPVKAEPEGDSPMALDEDIYEDAGDLDFYDQTLPNNPFGSMYLARIPSYVWEAWAKFEKLDDDAEIQIGTIRQWTELDAAGQKQHRMRLLLRSDLAQHQDVPKEYELDLNPMNDPAPTVTKNTFVFTEQDLPGFKAKNKARADAHAAGIPASIIRQKDRVEKPAQGQGQGQVHGRRGRQAYYRKAIPKKTAIYGKIKHEINCVPVKNPETDFIMNQRALEAMKPKATVKFGDASKSGLRIIGVNTIAGHEGAAGFIKTTPAAPKTKKAEMKTARMPENELLDAIFLAFDSYRYISLKSFRQMIPQPEAYLRQTLEKIADLHRSGRFANQWELREENRRETSTRAEVKAELTGTAEDDSDGDDADVKMEDVVL